MSDRVLVFIGLAARAGKLVYGSEAGSIAVRQRRAELVIVAQDASGNTKKLMYNKCSSNSVIICEYSDMQSLGNAVGKGVVSVIGITDKGFAKEILNKMNRES